MKYLIPFIIIFVSISLIGQSEVELRTDGIIVPNVDTGSVSSPSIGQVIYNTSTNQLMYFDGTKWSVAGGAFERNGMTVRQREGYDTDNFVMGRSAIPPDSAIGGNFFFYNGSKAAFRGGTPRTTGLQPNMNWSPDSLGKFSFAYGQGVRASGTRSVAMGVNTIASEDAAIALGGDSKALGANCVALGHANIASGSSSIALGYRSEAIGYRSSALGNDATASGDNSVALGWATQARGKGMTVVGMFNELVVPEGSDTAGTNPVFMVGNGSGYASGRSNAMIIQKNGNIGIGTDLPTSLVHQSYNSSAGDGQMKLTEEGADWARLILENDQNPNYWTVSARPYTNASQSNINFNYRDVTGGTGSSNKLRVYGNGDATLEGMLTQNSDKRLKTNINRISNSLGIIQEINGYRYNWKTDNPQQKKQIGLLAQEVQKVLPEIVRIDEKGILSISYSSLIPVLIEGFKEQQETITKVVLENKSLTKEIKEIKKILLAMD